MITLKQDAIFTLCIAGRELPGFRLISEWEGLKKLQNSNGDTVILAPTKGRSWVDEMFEKSSFFGVQGEPAEYVPIMASPSIAEFIKPRDSGDATGCNGVGA